MKNYSLSETELHEIISKTVKETVLNLKMSGLMRNGGNDAYHKTEDMLRRYKSFKQSNQPYAKKLVKRIDAALVNISADPYYEIIKLFYVDGESRESIADRLGVSETTVSRNKHRLICRMQDYLFTDDTIEELFLV